MQLDNNENCLTSFLAGRLQFDFARLEFSGHLGWMDLEVFSRFGGPKFHKPILTLNNIRVPFIMHYFLVNGYLS
jgi:hypothetical protein